MEIKVGMYVRTKWGIARLTGECWEDFGGDTAYAVDCCLLPINETKILKEDILGEPSDNIIDLIEAGDYVNGYKVSFKDNDYKPFVQCDYSVQGKTTNHYKFYEEAIYSIVTKEQFESMSYKVGE